MFINFLWSTSYDSLNGSTFRSRCFIAFVIVLEDKQSEHTILLTILTHLIPTLACCNIFSAVYAYLLHFICVYCAYQYNASKCVYYAFCCAIAKCVTVMCILHILGVCAKCVYYSYIVPFITARIMCILRISLNAYITHFNVP